MSWVAAVAIAIVLLAIAIVVIGREARRMAAEEPRAVFDLEDAVAYVADHVPFDVAAELSYDDVRRIIRFHLDYVRVRSSSPNGHEPGMPGPVVAGGPDVVEFIVGRGRDVGQPYTPEQVTAVLDAELGYLESIGAIGPPADPGAPA